MNIIATQTGSHIVQEKIVRRLRMQIKARRLFERVNKTSPDAGLINDRKFIKFFEEPEELDYRYVY